MLDLAEFAISDDVMDWANELIRDTPAAFMEEGPEGPLGTYAHFQKHLNDPIFHQANITVIRVWLWLRP